MGNMYYLWSAASQGWATHSGTYSSELKDAKQYERHDALARCILHYRKNDGTMGLIAMPVTDVEEVTQ